MHGVTDFNTERKKKPITVAERSMARVSGHSLAGIAGSNPAGSMMDVCLL
jgi:hypothetical protein